jgi:hypothetical protein
MYPGPTPRGGGGSAALTPPSTIEGSRRCTWPDHGRPSLHGTIGTHPGSAIDVRRPATVDPVSILDVLVWLSWDQQSLTNSFNTMTLPTCPHIRSGSSTPMHRTTPHLILVTSLFRAPNHVVPSSILVGNGSVLPITSVGDTVLLDPFYLNNVLVTLDIIKNLLFVRQFITDNWSSMKFDPFGLSVEDLATRNVITRCNSSEHVYSSGVHILRP